MQGTRDAAEIAALVFLDLAVIVLLARVAGGALRRLRQPAVIGEILAGILLGPTLLGALPGDLPAELFPPDVRPYLRVLGDLGLILFMFMVGLQLDLRLVRRLERAAAISASSVVVPFLLGLLLAGGLHDSHGIVAGTKVDFAPFALFIAAAMSITAFPVLARILQERGMYRTNLGALVLACAAIDDVLGWCVLAVALAALGDGGSWGLPEIVASTALFSVLMVAVVRPLLLTRLAAWYRRAGALTPGLLAVVVAAIAVSSWATHALGVHFIFGAFLLGAIFPREHSRDFFESFATPLEPFVVVLLLPVFFVLPGLTINLRELGLDELGELAVILLAACGGKLLGGAGMARLQGFGWREAGAIGTLMNTRGLMELVVLNVGFTAGVLDRKLFALMVVMAVVTTVMTEPLLRVIYPDRLVARDVARAEASVLERLPARPAPS